PLTVPPGAAITFGPDGTLSILDDGDKPKTLSQIGQLKLIRIDPDNLHQDDSGLFTLTDAARAQRGSALPADPALRLKSGAFEGSNVSPVQTMVEMIGNARSFEMQMKVISNVNDNARAGNQLLAIG
ncbi:flagellar basal body rod C-terminal domain-containing protein, partial [Sodalis-like endosymbiont of Proechinophthirus fluctus]|uniref:flagellar basal body rod C-terminal domain-containing protein n=1 Tax=Sodalis-like endosymbiont of Proechinophthirus fluctus TaxID=1462730 RepID=UPI0027390E07